jgi:hypothetical protein
LSRERDANKSAERGIVVGDEDRGVPVALGHLRGLSGLSGHEASRTFTNRSPVDIWLERRFYGLVAAIRSRLGIALAGEPRSASKLSSSGDANPHPCLRRDRDPDLPGPSTISNRGGRRRRTVHWVGPASARRSPAASKRQVGSRWSPPEAVSASLEQTF